MDIEEVAWRLWAILDDIDTMDDVAKSDDHWYRFQVRALQKKRHKIMSGDLFTEIGRKRHLFGNTLLHTTKEKR